MLLRDSRHNYLFFLSRLEFLHYCSIRPEGAVSESSFGFFSQAFNTCCEGPLLHVIAVFQMQDVISRRGIKIGVAILFAESELCPITAISYFFWSQTLCSVSIVYLREVGTIDNQKSNESIWQPTNDATSHQRHHNQQSTIFKALTIFEDDVSARCMQMWRTQLSEHVYWSVWPLSAGSL